MDLEHYETDMSLKHYKVTARKLRRVLRFVQKRQIPMLFKYEYNNSMDEHEERYYNGIVDSYQVDKTEYDGVWYLTIHVKFKNGDSMEESVNDTWWTIAKVRPNPMKGMVLIGNNGDGTENVFVMERTDFK